MVADAEGQPIPSGAGDPAEGRDARVDTPSEEGQPGPLVAGVMADPDYSWAEHGKPRREWGLLLREYDWCAATAGVRSVVERRVAGWSMPTRR